MRQLASREKNSALGTNHRIFFSALFRPTAFRLILRNPSSSQPQRVWLNSHPIIPKLISIGKNSASIGSVTLFPPIPTSPTDETRAFPFHVVHGRIFYAIPSYLPLQFAA